MTQAYAKKNSLKIKIKKIMLKWNKMDISLFVWWYIYIVFFIIQNLNMSNFALHDNKGIS